MYREVEINTGLLSLTDINSLNFEDIIEYKLNSTELSHTVKATWELTIENKPKMIFEFVYENKKDTEIEIKLKAAVVNFGSGAILNISPPVENPSKIICPTNIESENNLGTYEIKSEGETVDINFSSDISNITEINFSIDFLILQLLKLLNTNLFLKKRKEFYSK